MAVFRCLRNIMVSRTERLAMTENTYTLDRLRSDIDKTFSPVRLTLVDGEEIVLRSILRLGEKDRKSVLEDIRTIQRLQKEDEAEADEESEAGIQRLETLEQTGNRILERVAQKGKAKKLLADIDGDIPLTLEIIKTWVEATNPGEAQPSPAS
jgi:Mycobacteriophage tail assembly protein